MPRSRPLLAALALVSSAVLLSGLAACGTDEPADGAESSGSESADPAGSADRPTAEAGAFPVTVEHADGETTIESEPQRVVTVGYADQDFLLALGVAPVGVTDWYGDYPAATWPWARDELGDAEPTVLNEGQFDGGSHFNFEAIAALQPDLIIGLYIEITPENYEKLSAIAPTVAPPADAQPFGASWQQYTRLAAQAVGRPAYAEELIADVEGRFETAAAEHPEFDGLEVVLAERFEPGVTFVRSPKDQRSRFFTSLGFVIPDEIGDLSKDSDGAEISDEQMDVLDRDLLVWNVGDSPEVQDEVESNGVYPQLDVVDAGRDVWISDPLISGALTWGTVLSLPYALDHVLPLLEKAVPAA